MEVKIGVQHAPREIVVETELSAEELESTVTAALTGATPLLSLTDAKGRKVLVPTDRLSYVDIGEPAVRKVGFGAA
ncbi:DUF3107 domain-containing protein [Streptomyces sp. BI20]|uniref:DUF3107 domain-containing protein n=1 Tax=Streptomyces sp. BI20 TaxID=3403460 RepID=UPI003C72A117